MGALRYSMQALPITLTITDIKKSPESAFVLSESVDDAVFIMKNGIVRGVVLGPKQYAHLLKKSNEHPNDKTLPDRSKTLYAKQEILDDPIHIAEINNESWK
jgi:hypothetical protein